LNNELLVYLLTYLLTYLKDRFVASVINQLVQDAITQSQRCCLQCLIQSWMATC